MAMKKPQPKPAPKKPVPPSAKVGNYRAPVDTAGMAKEDKDFFFPKGGNKRKGGK